MTNGLPLPLQILVEKFSKFPGIGPKTALRFVFHLLKLPKEELLRFCENLSNLETIQNCQICQNVTQKSPCVICSNPKRDRSVICVVAESMDMRVIEATNEYRGLYHVLGGKINPYQKNGLSQLKINELLSRLPKKGKKETASAVSSVQEVILALNPTIEGESTMLYLTKLLHPYDIKITRLARGLPVGGELEYADQITLGDALIGRKEV